MVAVILSEFEEKNIIMILELPFPVMDPRSMKRRSPHSPSIICSGRVAWQKAKKAREWRRIFYH